VIGGILLHDLIDLSHWLAHEHKLFATLWHVSLAGYSPSVTSFSLPDPLEIENIKGRVIKYSSSNHTSVTAQIKCLELSGVGNYFVYS
jgi:hypothetical protein